MWPRKGELRYPLGGRFYTLAWGETGSPSAPPVLCVHGLTRNARDFDTLADGLSDRFLVICPDLPGRGRSEWLADPALYQPASYVVALSHLLAAINRPVAWVGTSLGGICGMLTAAMPGAPITRLVLNDIGPAIPAAALARIRDYMGAAPASFPTLAALEQHLRRVHAPFGALTDAQWAHLARHSHRQLPDGTLGLHYDPAIATPILAAEPTDVDLWAVWDQIAVPRLVLRGESSDLLEESTFARMGQSGATTRLVRGAGHAPALMDSASIGAVRSFLLGV